MPVQAWDRHHFFVQYRDEKLVGGIDLNILVINAGSSSLKYQLVNIATHKVVAKGLL